MTKINAIYKCNICGNIVEVLQQAGGTLVCCGKPMTLKDELTKEGVGEKHLPLVEKREDGVFHLLFFYEKKNCEVIKKS